MPTVKEIKAELKAEGIEYPRSANKLELEVLLGLFHSATAPVGKPEAPNFNLGDGTTSQDPEEASQEHEDRPRHIKHKRPKYIEPDADFVDPNANRPDQAV